MATERYCFCTGCRGKSFPPGTFLALLSDFPNSLPKCGRCGAVQELHLVPPFALGAGKRDCSVLAAFHDSSIYWENEGEKVTFFPFLVILKHADDEEPMVWLPYWHLDGTKAKFGERAPWMDMSALKRLLAQANSKGFKI